MQTTVFGIVCTRMMQTIVFGIATCSTLTTRKNVHFVIKSAVRLYSINQKRHPIIHDIQVMILRQPSDIPLCHQVTLYGTLGSTRGI